MKKQEIFTWEYDNNLKPGCIIQLERYIRILLETHIINHQFITKTDDNRKSLILSMIFITTKL